MMSPKQSTYARSTYAPQHKVLTNDDLLTQILIRLPILCIHLFTTVSKQWLRILTSPNFTRNRSQIQKIDPPVGLFVNHITSSFHCVFVSLDTRIKSRKYTSDKSFTLGSTEAVDNVNILQSYNGLLLCTGWGGTHFDYVYNPSTNLVKMLLPDYSHDDSNFYGCAGLRLAFDPTKSHDYKVVRAGSNSCIQIPHMLHLEGKLFESRGCLVLVRRDYIGSSEFTIYEMTKGCSVCLVLGEREEDSFLVMNLSRKVVLYNLISKTLREIYDMGSNEVADDYLHGFILPFAMYDMRYKKLNHKVYEFISSSASV
ncbi:zinc finger, CCHC-type containing protein [Tanacetum coccineum]